MLPVVGRQKTIHRRAFSFMADDAEIEELFGTLAEDHSFVPRLAESLPQTRKPELMTTHRTLELGAIFERSAELHLPCGRRPTLSEYDNRRDSVVTDRIHFGVFPHE